MKTPILQYVSLPLITNAKCSEPWGGHVTEDTVCAGYPEGGAGVCQGDSGGPLIVPRSSNDRSAVIYGIVSFGGKCGEAKKPPVFARVSKFIPWIKTFL